MRFLRLGVLSPFVLVACVGDAPTVNPTPDASPDSLSPFDAGADVAAGDASDAGPSSVTGTVVDDRDNPIANADVRIAGADAKTDSTGKFTLVAPATYDVLVVNATAGTTIDTSTGKKLTAFLGISSRTPRLQVFGGTARSTSVTINTTGVTTPLPSSDSWYVVTAPTTNSSSTTFGLSPNNAQTVSQTTWSGVDPAKGQLYGYLVTTAANFPTAWKAQVTPTAFTIGGATATLTANFNGGPPAVGDLNVTIATSGHTMTGYFVGHDPAPGARRLFGQVSGFTQTTHVAKLPTTGSAFVTARGTTAAGNNALAWRAGISVPKTITVTLPAGDVALTAPAANATGVAAGTSFAWTAPAGTMHYVRLNCGQSPPSYLADILVGTSSFTLPDATALGVPLPIAATCTWVVTSFAPVANVDALVGPAGWLNAANFSRATIDGTALSTQARPFTSK